MLFLSKYSFNDKYRVKTEQLVDVKIPFPLMYASSFLIKKVQCMSRYGNHGGRESWIPKNLRPAV